MMFGTWKVQLCFLCCNFFDSKIKINLSSINLKNENNMPLIDIIRPEKPVMNICMMGPKAVGKTTVLTAVFNETQNSISGTTLNLTAKGDTEAELMDRLHMLHAIFAKKKSITDNSQTISNAGISASSYESRFDFGFGHIGKEPIIDLTIKDFPGEMVVNNQDEVIKFIRDSQSIFVAIDTPHLMERNGEFNDVKNKPKHITELFKKAIKDIESEKLVLLIPLKCEKYFHEGRMVEVLERVEKIYSELISILEENRNICCCVTPIQTLGDVDFDTFTFDGKGIKLASDGCPADVKYKYVGKGEYSPYFCSQPLYSMLLFVAAQYKRVLSRMGPIDRLRNAIWRVFNSDDSLFDEIYKMNRSRITDNLDLGYKIICGNRLFDCK